MNNHPSIFMQDFFRKVILIKNRLGFSTHLEQSYFMNVFLDTFRLVFSVVTNSHEVKVKSKTKTFTC